MPTLTDSYSVIILDMNLSLVTFLFAERLKRNFHTMSFSSDVIDLVGGDKMIF